MNLIQLLPFFKNCNHSVCVFVQFYAILFHVYIYACNHNNQDTELFYHHKRTPSCHLFVFLCSHSKLLSPATTNIFSISMVLVNGIEYFSCAYLPPYYPFSEIAIHGYCPFYKIMWGVFVGFLCFFLLLSFDSSLYSLVQVYKICWICSQQILLSKFIVCLFHPLNSLSQCKKIFDGAQLIDYFLLWIMYLISYLGILCPQSQRCSPMFSSQLCFTCKPRILLELMFIYSMKFRLRFIFLSTDVQLFQYHLLKRLPFLH